MIAYCYIKVYIIDLIVVVYYHKGGYVYIKNVAFKSRIVYENSKNGLSTSQKEYIDLFEEGKVNDTKFLGEGVTSKAYYSSSQDFVIKQNKLNPYIPEKHSGEMGSLGHENRILSAISDKVKTTQKAVGYVETAKGGKFLLSTFVPGAPADRWTNPFKEKHIDRLLRNLYRLDKSEIIHCDLSRPNLLLNSNYDVNIIDYQWGETFNIFEPTLNYNLKNSIFPSFELPNNATMFETAALPGYLRNMNQEDAEDFLKKYLKNKAIYTEKKYKRIVRYFSEHPSLKDNFSDFEKAKTTAYSAQDSNILTAELLKMNMLNSHRRQYSCYDSNKIEPRNMLRAIPLMFKTKEFADKLSKIKEFCSVDTTYFNYMNKYGKLWQENINNWYPKTIEWLFKVITGYAAPKGNILFPSKFDDFSSLDVAEIKNDVSIVKKSFWDRLFYTDEVAVAEQRLIQLFKNSYNDISAYYRNQNEVSRIATNIFKKTF